MKTAIDSNAKANNPRTLDDAMSVYSGKDGRCCCGCSGKHTYASVYLATASANRGYPVSPDEVNDRTVKRIFNKVMQCPDEPLDDEVYTARVVGKRLYIVYWLPKPAAGEGRSA